MQPVVMLIIGDCAFCW